MVDAKSLFDFKKQCQSFVAAILEKMRERILVGVGFLKHTFSVDPATIISISKDRCAKRFRGVVHIFSRQLLISTIDGDKSYLQCVDFINSKSNLSNFNEF